MGWWPGWNTIEGADWWHEFFWWLGIACLAGLVVSEVVVFHGGNIIEPARGRYLRRPEVRSFS
jgi:hypothetical protein